LTYPDLRHDDCPDVMLAAGVRYPLRHIVQVLGSSLAMLRSSDKLPVIKNETGYFSLKDR
jgi:hypothetical protein